MANRLAIQRFQKFIELDLLTGCWLWKGAIRKDGYGHFNLKYGSVFPHRFSYEYWNGKIPQGLQIDHLCRNKNCVNPAHLEAVTGDENRRRGLSYKHHSQKTHCPQGHEYNEENTYYQKFKDGKQSRKCIACNKINTTIQNTIRRLIKCETI